MSSPSASRALGAYSDPREPLCNFPKDHLHWDLVCLKLSAFGRLLWFFRRNLSSRQQRRARGRCSVVGNLPATTPTFAVYLSCVGVKKYRATRLPEGECCLAVSSATRRGERRPAAGGSDDALRSVHVGGFYDTAQPSWRQSWSVLCLVLPLVRKFKKNIIVYPFVMYGHGQNNRERACIRS